MGRISRIGLLGGTFDPPHIGHLIMAECARDHFHFKSVHWVVAADPPHKKDVKISPVDVRIELVRAAIAPNDTFLLSRLDVDRPGPHYTVDMLSLAAAELSNSELYFLLGSDSIQDLPSWHEPGRLGDHATLCVYPRSANVTDSNMALQVEDLFKIKVKIIDGPIVDISSSAVRKRVASKQSVRYLVPEAVNEIIKSRRLYAGNA